MGGKGRKTLIIAVLSATMLAIPLGGSGSAADVVVTPGNLNGWVADVQNPLSNASYSFVTGPGTPPAGIGSLELRTGNPGSKPRITSPVGGPLQGVRLADITALDYSTYIQQYAAGQHLTGTLNLIVDPDGTGPLTNATLVFEPCYGLDGCAGPVQPLNTWTSWNTLTATAGWWGPGADPCGLGAGGNEDWADVLSSCPNATILMVVLQAGQGSGGAPWTDFIGNVDALRIVATQSEVGPGADYLYDLDPAPTEVGGIDVGRAYSSDDLRFTG